MRLAPFNKSFLGLAIGEKTAVAAQVSAQRSGWQVDAVAEFELPASDLRDAPEALRRFLRQNGFSASHVVLGVPARWLLTRQQEIPPTDPAQAADILRLQAERMFSSELKDLVHDYAGTPDRSQAQKVLLAALPKSQLDRIVKLAEDAGLTVEGVTPSVLALAGATGEAEKEQLLLSLTSDAVELMIGGRAPTLLRHLSARGPDPTAQNGTREGAVRALGSEVRRVIALSPWTNGSSSPPLQVWDSIGLETAETEAFAERAGVQVTSHGDLSRMGVACKAPGRVDASRFAPAVALALSSAQLAGKRQPLAINFLHPRLAAPRTRRIGRRTVWGTVLGATLVLGIGALVFDVQTQKSELKALQAKLTEREPEMKSAEAQAQRFSSARGWFDARPPMLDCLRDITLAFRTDEPIYVTSFTLRDNRKGQLSGRSSDQRAVLSLLDRLKTSKKFGNVMLLEMRDAGTNSREVAFSLSFTYNTIEALASEVKR